MIPIDFTPEDIDALHHERFDHPHPRVQQKMEVVYLKGQLLHKDICRLSRIRVVSLQERCKRNDGKTPRNPGLQ